MAATYADTACSAHSSALSHEPATATGTAGLSGTRWMAARVPKMPDVLSPPRNVSLVATGRSAAIGCSSLVRLIRCGRVEARRRRSWPVACVADRAGAQGHIVPGSRRPGSAARRSAKARTFAAAAGCPVLRDSSGPTWTDAARASRFAARGHRLVWSVLLSVDAFPCVNERLARVKESAAGEVVNHSEMCFSCSRNRPEPCFVCSDGGKA